MGRNQGLTKRQSVGTRYRPVVSVGINWLVPIGAVGQYHDHARDQPLVYLVCNARSMNKERSDPSH